MVGDFLFGKIPEIHFGPGKLELLPSLVRRYGKNVLLVTGARSFTKSRHYCKLAELLKEQSVKHYLVRVTGEPSPALIDGIVGEYLLKDVDLILAIGGGSVIDTGKAIAAMMSQDGFVQEFLEGVGSGRVHAGRKIPFIAVPTTAGTGSETTRNAVLSTVGRTGFKKSLRHQSLIPDIALVDPELSVTCPVHITAACGMDAFTQLLESYVSLNSSSMTDALCLSGLSGVMNGLIRAVNEPENIEARSSMSYAAMISGITLANAGLGTVHGFASVIGGYFEVPHGVVCGTLMGAVTRANIAFLQEKLPSHPALDKYAKAGRLFSGDPSLNQKESCFALTTVIDEWTAELRMPRLGQYGIQPGDLDKIANETDQKQNPVILSHSALLNILNERL